MKLTRMYILRKIHILASKASKSKISVILKSLKSKGSQHLSPLFRSEAPEIFDTKNNSSKKDDSLVLLDELLKSLK